MSDINILEQLLQDSAKVSITPKYDRKTVFLTEDKSEESIVQISCLPDEVIVIKADAFSSPDSVFRGTKGECKRADFIIIGIEGRKKTILYIELKKTKASEKEIIEQLKGAKCFVAYCRDIVGAFWGTQDFLVGYEERFISYAYTGIRKTRTRINQKTGRHDKPENFMRISQPYYQAFRKLVGS